MTNDRRLYIIRRYKKSSCAHPREARSSTSSSSRFRRRKGHSSPEQTDYDFGKSLVSGAKQIPPRSQRQFTKCDRERRPSTLDLLSEFQIGGALLVRQTFAT